ncbi:hypothetical protein BO86DRAFT_123166 [Aspergillus japonicus CBS 114.51]|uniref:Uncharacterized protein n=2 Tax=Aspergillus TaxID=5052 RepID=A0A2V5HB22_ASPV1|nr:hypothetical protein BO86DRAFT_123166 [Aspergillus japonicus CBS 114.51]PYI21578.1 hypothetical protein BO99DRAFT_71151 [Aspergillus violaceofuscus CBS 115571]RAH80751.1 hypothetical protein BO86DRAFT_123166 [Aspergillus japonicus CBS 114.51]
MHDVAIPGWACRYLAWLIQTQCDGSLLLERQVSRQERKASQMVTGSTMPNLVYLPTSWHARAQSKGARMPAHLQPLLFCSLLGRISTTKRANSGSWMPDFSFDRSNGLIPGRGSVGQDKIQGNGSGQTSLTHARRRQPKHENLSEYTLINIVVYIPMLK